MVLLHGLLVMEYLPTKLSLRLSKSEDVLVYENPTPTGDSKNNIFASAIHWFFSWIYIKIFHIELFKTGHDFYFMV